MSYTMRITKILSQDLNLNTQDLHCNMTTSVGVFYMVGACAHVFLFHTWEANSGF